ncbi:MAG: SDR family oxidoreductase, partial [Thermoguttaceae bacterium]|nr:SDR family oxidoreductase [Thermoguttaceae bacterium]
LASVSALFGNPGQANYSASKAAIIAFTRTIAKELGNRNITANAIAPGFIETDMTAVLKDIQKQVMIDRTPLGRMGQPEDIASAVLFFASDDAAFITGQTLVVDGGLID